MRSAKVQPSRGGPTRARIQELGAALQTSLNAVLAEAVGPGLRPVTIVKVLKIDDSLAAKLLRALRNHDPLSTLREIPAPQGLRLFLDSTSKTAVTPAARHAAEKAVNAFEQFINELPMGRTSLDAAIDGWLPSGRARAERAGKPAVFKVFSQTLGYTIDTCCLAIAVQPSARGDTCDGMSFVAMDGVRRLRDGALILLLGHGWRPNDVNREGIPPQIVETLDGEREATDGRKLIMPDVGEGLELPVRLIERGPHRRMMLESNTPPLNVPITAGMGFVTRNMLRRYQTPDCKTESFLNACKVPIKVFVQDFFLHEDVFPNFVPNVTPRVDSATTDYQVRDEELVEIDRLDLDVELVRLGWGLDRIGIKEWAGYEPGLASAFRRCGWDPSRFRAFRCYIRYPFPFVSLTTWFDLPSAP